MPFLEDNAFPQQLYPFKKTVPYLDNKALARKKHKRKNNTGQ